MNRSDITIINHSALVSEAELKRMLPALQMQITRDFAPLWGVDATLSINNPDPDSWQVVILNDTDQAGLLGYHDFTATGQPLAKVFARDIRNGGGQLSVVLSHELLEMLADPALNIVYWVDRPGEPPRLYAGEVCDPCQADNYGYLIGETLVSDFITPAYFETFRQPHSARFDFCGLLTAPLEILTDGYMSVCTMLTGARWRQITSSLNDLPPNRRGKRGSRRERRERAQSETLHPSCR